MVLRTAPSRVTVIFFVFASTVETWLRPILKVTVLLCTPWTPGAPWTPSSASFSVTVEPACQYCSGRKSRRWALNQWPTTSWPLLEETEMPAWTAFLSLIALLKVIETGMPTPTVWPSSGTKEATKLFSGETVVKEAFSCASLPSASLAVAASAYLVERLSAPFGFQLLPSAAMSPATAVPSLVLSSTWVSVPSVTVTFAASLRPTLVAPSFGAMVILALEVSLAAAASTSAWDLLASPLPFGSPPLSPPSLHAESTSTPPSTTDMAARDLLRRLLSVLTRHSIVAGNPETAVPGWPGRGRTPLPGPDNALTAPVGSTFRWDVGNHTVRRCRVLRRSPHLPRRGPTPSTRGRIRRARCSRRPARAPPRGCPRPGQWGRRGRRGLRTRLP